MRVLIDRIEGNVAIARSSADAPEIDGTVRIARGKTLRVGDFADVRITGSGAYDLEAVVAAKLV
jgi:ribosomal protein S12 methylthiotransferase